MTAGILRHSVTTGAPTDAERDTWAARTPNLPTVYLAALAVWLVTRWLVLVHQGAWPWMNAFVVAAARGMVVGDWNQAVRPQLPAVLGVPLVLAGASEQQTVAALYVVASLVQFGAFVVLVRALFPGQVQAQGLGLLVFLLVPYNHSIHHYRDVPVVLASSAVFLLAADFIRTFRTQPFTFGGSLAARLAFGRSRSAPPISAAVRRENSPQSTPARGMIQVANASSEPALRDQNAPASCSASREVDLVRPSGVFTERGRIVSSANPAREGGKWNAVFVFAALLLGVWSRTEVLTFVGVLVVLALVVWRKRALRLAATYVTAAVVVSGGLLLVYRLEGVDLSEASRYQVHTFLDSTPESWLTPDCLADETENCRAADGAQYFGPVDPQAGVLALVRNHPLTTLAKTLRSAWDNLWILLGPNMSTFPGIVPFIVVVVALARPARELLARVPVAVWLASAAVVAESVLPPLSWAPPHPQYHLQLVFPIVALLVPLLAGLARMPRGRLLVLAFFVGNAGLSAFRYTRYPGY